MTHTIVVTPEARAFFTAVVPRTRGGFQSLKRMLAVRLAASETLHLSREEFERLVRYATDYGDGGYQRQLRQLVGISTRGGKVRPGSRMSARGTARKPRRTSGRSASRLR
jgi:hypothetical protein